MGNFVINNDSPEISIGSHIVREIKVSPSVSISEANKINFIQLVEFIEMQGGSFEGDLGLEKYLRSLSRYQIPTKSVYSMPSMTYDSRGRIIPKVPRFYRGHIKNFDSSMLFDEIVLSSSLLSKISHNQIFLLFT